MTVDEAEVMALYRDACDHESKCFLRFVEAATPRDHHIALLAWAGAVLTRQLAFDELRRVLA